MDIQNFKSYLDKELESFLNSKIKSSKNVKNKTYKEILIQAKKISLSGGKRVRPYLIYLSSFSFKKENKKDLDKILNLCLAMEIFHIFCLIHDDIIDQDEIRHSEMTLHQFAYKKLKFDKKTSESSALLIGDLYFGYVLELLNKYSEKTRSIFFEMIDEVVYGQFLDIEITCHKKSNEEEIENKNYLKTAKYTFTRPIDLGFSINNSDILKTNFSEKIGKELGVAYQIQDDLISLIGTTKEFGKDELSDIKTGNHTFFSNFVFKTKYKKDLNSFFGSHRNFNKNEKKQIQNIFEKSGSILAGQELFKEKILNSELLIRKNNFSNLDKWLKLLEILEKRVK
jgi:geranylgeranyl diphosphate synthase, type I